MLLVGGGHHAGKMNFALRLVVSAMAVALSSLVQGAPHCVPETKVSLNVTVNPADFIALSAIPVPDSCPNFDIFALATCQAELGFAGGCCDPKCVGVFDTVAQECLHTFFKLICEQNPDLVPILETLSSRCKDGFSPEGCDAPDKDGPGAKDPSALEDMVGETARGDSVVPEKNAVLRAGDADTVNGLSRDDDGAGNGLSLCGTLLGVAALLAMVVV